MGLIVLDDLGAGSPHVLCNGFLGGRGGGFVHGPRRGLSSLPVEVGRGLGAGRGGAGRDHRSSSGPRPGGTRRVLRRRPARAAPGPP